MPKLKIFDTETRPGFKVHTKTPTHEVSKVSIKYFYLFGWCIYKKTTYL